MVGVWGFGSRVRSPMPWVPQPQDGAHSPGPGRGHRPASLGLRPPAAAHFSVSPSGKRPLFLLRPPEPGSPL